MSEARASVTRAICDILGWWANGCPVRDARIHLARLLAMLEAVEDRVSVVIERAKPQSSRAATEVLLFCDDQDEVIVRGIGKKIVLEPPDE